MTSVQPAETPAGSAPWRQAIRQLLAPLLPIWALLKVVAPIGKVFGVLKTGKLAGTLISMGLAILGYSLVWGWPFAAGFIGILLIHELGHVVAAAARGVPVTAPLFIPFAGAFIQMKDRPHSVCDEAVLAAGGPVAGLLAALAVWGAGTALHSPVLLAVAFTGFYLHLFNLLPVTPLDGGRMAAAVSRWFWPICAPLFLGYALWRGSGIHLLVLWWGWQEFRHQPAPDYYRIPSPSPAGIGALYLLLLGLSALGVWQSGAALEGNHYIDAGNVSEGMLDPRDAVLTAAVLTAIWFLYGYWLHWRGRLFVDKPAATDAESAAPVAAAEPANPGAAIE